MRDYHKVIIDKEKCIKCGFCISDCPMNVLEMRDDGIEVTIDSCLMCGHCLAICPKKAIDISGFEDEPIELTEERKINSEEFLMHMKSRRSVRKFTKEKISKEDIIKILEAGQYSPTATNSQGVSYTIIKNNIKEYEKITVNVYRRLKKVAGLFTNKFDKIDFDDNYLFKNAPIVIVVKSKNVVDGSLAAGAMEIMAQSMGLGVFYSGMFAIVANNSKKLKKMLRVGKKERVVTALVIGHTDINYKRTAPKEKPSVFLD